MVSYLLAFFGGLGMIWSFFGLGSIFCLIFFSKKGLNAGFKIILGLFVFLLAGAYLNFFRVISRSSLLVF